MADGALAEEAVGETLEELRREGWTVMHDVVFGEEGELPALSGNKKRVLSLEDVYDYAKHLVKDLLPCQEVYCKSTDNLIQRHIPLAHVR